MNFLENRTLWHTEVKQERGQLVRGDTNLDTVYGRLTLIEVKQAHQDVSGTIRDVAIPHFDRSSMRFALKDNFGPLRVARTAANQMASTVLPAGFWSGFKQLIELPGGKHEGIRDTALCAPYHAELVWNDFARQSDAPRVFRTSEIRHPNGNTERIIRACVSDQYAQYGHVQLIHDFREYLGEYSVRPVLSATLTDRSLRVRFAALSDAMAVFSAMDPTLLQSVSFPMVEFWNSETGQCGVRMQGGLYRFAASGKSYGLPHPDSYVKRGWIHRGSLTRIRDSVKATFASAIGMATAMDSAFEEAKDVRIDDPYAATAKQLSKALTEKQLEVYKREMGGEEKGTQASLAYAVDVLGAIAADEEDPLDQAVIEQAASELLGRVLKVSQNERSSKLSAAQASALAELGA